jgi:hypothetical protein
MDRQTDGQTDGQRDRQTEKRRGSKRERQKNREVVRQKDRQNRQMNEYTKGWADSSILKQVNRPLAQTNRHMDKQIDAHRIDRHRNRLTNRFIWPRSAK